MFGYFYPVCFFFVTGVAGRHKAWLPRINKIATQLETENGLCIDTKTNTITIIPTPPSITTKTVTIIMSIKTPLQYQQS